MSDDELHTQPAAMPAPITSRIIVFRTAIFDDLPLVRSVVLGVAI